MCYGFKSGGVGHNDVGADVTIGLVSGCETDRPIPNFDGEECVREGKLPRVSSKGFEVNEGVYVANGNEEVDQGSKHVRDVVLMARNSAGKALAVQQRSIGSRVVGHSGVAILGADSRRLTLQVLLFN